MVFISTIRKQVETHLTHFSTQIPPLKAHIFFLNQVKIPWLMTRTSMILTQWQGCWSCISEDWRTLSSQRSGSWTSSPPSVSHAQQKAFKAVTVVSGLVKQKRENTPCSFLDNQPYCGIERHAVQQMEAFLIPGNSAWYLTRKWIGRGPHQFAIYKFPSICNGFDHSACLRGLMKGKRGELLKCQISVFRVLFAFCFSIVASLWSIIHLRVWFSLYFSGQCCYRLSAHIQNQNI